MAHQKLSEESEGWIQAGGITLTAQDILLELKAALDSDFPGQILRRKLAARITTSRGFQLSEDDLEAAEIDFFTARNLFDERQILAWLKSMNLDREQVRRHVLEFAIAEMAGSVLISDSAVEEQFSAARHFYARAQVETFEFPTPGRAREFILAVREKEITPAGGASIELTRREAPEEIAAELFSGEPEELFGPVENDSGSSCVYLLKGRVDAVLDDDLKEEIRGEILGRLLEAEFARDPLKFIE